MQYPKEPFDTKLFVLRFIKKSGFVLLAALLGAVLIGGGYYLKKVVFGGPKEYAQTTTYFIDYTTFKEETGELYNYTNSATWGTWVVTDWFVDMAWEYALEAGLEPKQFGIQKGDLVGYFYATMPTDLRMPEATVTTPYKELTAVLNQALQATFFDFAQSRPEMEQMTIVNETDVTVADKDVRTLRAVILGALIGFFAAGFGLAFVLIWDDSVVVPESLAYRYGLAVAGFINRGELKLSEEAITNVRYLLERKEACGLVLVGKGLEPQALKDMFEKALEGEIIVTKQGVNLKEADYEKLRAANALFLCVEAGQVSGKEVEHVLQNLQLQKCAVSGALLCGADGRLIGLHRLGCRK